MRPSLPTIAGPSAGTWRPHPSPRPPADPRAGIAAVAALTLMLLIFRLIPEGAASPHGIMVRTANLAIAAADLNMGLGHEASGAARAVATDPGLATPIGRQGARWLAANGAPAERLTWAFALVRSDPSELPLLQAAVTVAACSPDRKVRAEAARIASARQLEFPGRRTC